MQFKAFLAQIADNLANSSKRPVGRPSLDNIEPPPNVCRIQANLSRDTRKDGVDPMAKWNEKRQKCFHCKTGFSYISCKKCNIWLCLNKDRNCFKKYHIILLHLRVLQFFVYFIPVVVFV